MGKGKGKGKGKSLQSVCMEYVNAKSEKTYKIAIDRLRPGLWRHLATFESDFVSRETILTNVFATMWSKIDMYDPKKAYFSTWIYRVARNEALQHKRYTNRHASYNNLIDNGSKALSNSTEFQMPDEFFDERITEDPIVPLFDALVNRISTLSESEDKNGYRKSLHLRLIENKSYQEIATILNIPESTAKGNVFRGKSILRDLLLKEKPELISNFKKMIES